MQRVIDDIVLHPLERMRGGGMGAIGLREPPAIPLSAPPGKTGAQPGLAAGISEVRARTYQSFRASVFASLASALGKTEIRIDLSGTRY